ncbi:hypothetical protein D7D52_36150 [Nocardia yunnanensis]|uniref:Uncharacterized protein n=1 Tax=Nocardia yunnanensis TaxID=2382165 RepID=A0A386ZNU2_9NOCA|nr:hypothetical protein D7D52_36150 [Nocardia yunnanensis]
MALSDTARSVRVKSVPWRRSPRGRSVGGLALTVVVSCSPRMRGWSHRRLADFDRVTALPAHAGMVPTT